MKNKFDARIFVVAALAVALAASTGCRSGWKMGNPFSKAPKATDVDTPSELDELNDLTPPPENYTVGDASPKKIDDEKSLAQKGKYEAEETSKLAQTPDDASSLAQNSPSSAPVGTPANANANALAANLPPEPTQSFKTPDYSQSYQSADNFQVAQTSQTTQTPSATQSYQAPNSAPNAAQEFAATAPYVPAAQNDFPAVEANAFPTAQNAPAAVDHSTFNVAAAQNAPVAPQNGFPTVDPNAFPVAQNAPVAPAPAQPTYVAQNFPEPAPQAAPAPAAAAQDAYSGVHYQPQTTSGGFAPGSVGVY